MLKPVLSRLAFIEDYTLKSLRLKNEKWKKLVISDYQRGFLHSFVDQGRGNLSLGGFLVFGLKIKLVKNKLGKEYIVL